MQVGGWISPLQGVGRLAGAAQDEAKKCKIRVAAERARQQRQRKRPNCQRYQQVIVHLSCTKKKINHILSSMVD